MRKEKYFFGLLDRYLPEQEWEGKFLVEAAEKSNQSTALLLAFYLGIFSIGVIYLSLPCEVELDASVNGNFRVPQETNPLLDNLVVSSVDGKIKVKGPCLWLNYLFRR